MKKITQQMYLILTLCLGLSTSVFAQLTTPQASPLAKVMQRIGITDVEVEYSRPSVRDREIWGSNIVPYGYNNFGFGTSTAAPWRAGANENTIVRFSKDVQVEGKNLAAGAYGLHMAVEESGKVTVIFSKNTSSWGSYFYDPAEDALRVDVQWKDNPHTEMLSFAFTEVTTEKAVLSLLWEKKAIPMTISTNTQDLVIASMEEELRSSTGFLWQSWSTAAGYTVQQNYKLEKGLEWADQAVNNPNVGNKNFSTLSTKAQVLMRLGRMDEAYQVMDEALPMASVLQIHQYGRQLINMDQKAKALEVFEYNAKQNPNTWPVHLGLARGYSANGDYKKALKHAEMALNNAPNEPNKQNIQGAIEKLKKNEDIN